ncbi:MAG: acyl carrier protein [Oscillospiraceae bacterium]|nr:acyl carrier protein [Oscillospiraceae bacterium]
MIFEKLRAIIAEQFAISEDMVTMDTAFIDDLGVDSLDVVELTMAIEETFDVPEFDDVLIAKLITVGDLYKFLSDTCD